MMPNNNIMVCLVEKRPDFTNAACVGVPWEVFFPRFNDLGRVSREDMAKARKYCAVCPVQRECLEYACRTDSVGIWGGEYLSEHTARKLRKRNGWTLQREVIDDAR